MNSNKLFETQQKVLVEGLFCMLSLIWAYKIVLISLQNTYLFFSSVKVSFEKKNEWDFITTLMRGARINELWTAGRLCDAEVNGCDAPHYQPLPINGWFWASTLVQMLPTNRTVGLNADGVRVIGVNEWAPGQPNGFTPRGGLGEEPCMAIIDGKWHDTSCHNRRAIVCEDLPPHNIQFVRDNNPGVFIP